MLLQSSLYNQNVSLSSSIYYARPLLPIKTAASTHGQSICFQRLSIKCALSKARNYGTQDYKRRPIEQWNNVFKKIAVMKNQEFGSASVLNQWEAEGKPLSKWDLYRVVKALRKYKKHDRALEVYEWMNIRKERFRFSSSDAAIHLDLISKVHGVSAAEEYFLNLPGNLKDKKAYGALLNAYVQNKMKKKAESLLDTMRSKKYAVHALAFNVMMSLYLNLKEYDKVDLIVSEMMEKKVPLDVYSYNIWLSSCGLRGSPEKMEQVFEQMVKDNNINPNWTTFSTLATMYLKLDLLDKAEESLRKVESRISGRDRTPYHFLLHLYGSVGKKEEVSRVWNMYKSAFRTIPNLGYYDFICSLVRIGDIEGAEKAYEEWLSVTKSYSARIGNLLLNWYAKNSENTDKAHDFIKHMLEVGGKPNSNTWGIFATLHIRERKISEALSCFKEALMDMEAWRPRLESVSAFFNLCQEENDPASADILVELLRQSGKYNDKSFASLNGFPVIVENNSDNENTDDGSQTLLNQLEDDNL